MDMIESNHLQSYEIIRNLQCKLRPYAYCNNGDIDNYGIIQTASQFSTLNIKLF